MKRQLESKAFPIGELFAPPFLYESPSFQRPFAWDVDDAERLRADIQDALTEAPDQLYFLGAILLVRVPLPDDTSGQLPTQTVFSGPERVFHIIDGQQRIVTLSILLAVLRDLARTQGSGLAERLQRAFVALGSRGARVQLPGPDGAFLKHCVTEVGACLVPPLRPVATEPQQRILDARDYFAVHLKALTRAEFDAFAKFMLDNCSLVAIVTNTVDRAFQMFTVLNDTGKPLMRHDILKAELISQIAAKDRAKATEVWDDLAHRMDAEFEQLFSFVRTQRGRSSNTPIIEAVRAHVAATPGGAAGFVFDTLAPAGRIVDVILRAGHEGAPESKQINHLLRYLGWLPGKEWVPPLLAFWQAHGDNPQALLTFVQALDRFAYGVRLMGLGGEKRGQRMAAVTALVSGGNSALGPWPPLQLSRDELRTIAFSLRDLHKRSPQVCRLVLLRLNERLGGVIIPADVVLTVEHILPLKVAANSRWRSDFPDADARLKLATCLGNLTIVTGPVNERASNHDYARKCEIYFAVDAAPVSKLTAELRTIPIWTPAQIEDRLIRLTKALNEMWQLD